ncbi:alpha/beta fold hydrolase [Aquicoccus sp. SCR17]|nr:alpha/beta fold hydrolase [Carideicomes alvinocaridis]
MIWLTRIGIVVGVSVLVYLGIALGLILSQRATGAEMAGQGSGGGLDFSAIRGGESPERALERESYAGAGGTQLPVTVAGRDPSGAKPVLVMVHGSGWDGTQFDRLAARLADVAEVRVPTLRGHGKNPERRGDVDYIGQMEDDLAALLRDVEDGRPVVMLGHSSGGGLVVRFAGGAHGAMIDRAVLLAPFLQYDAPTTRENSGGWARPLTRRIIGLSMLNTIGIHALDHLTAMRFAMPREVLDGPEGDRATTAYSWRLNQGYAPRRDWRGDVAALPPFLLVAGTGDEAFRPDAYEPAMSEVTDTGRYLLVEGVGHLGIVNAPETEQAIREVLNDLG